MSLYKSVEITKFSPPIPARPSKEVLEKTKFLKGKKDSEKKNKSLYVQESTPKVSKILKIKEKFPNLSTKKIKNIHKMVNNSDKSKLRINMTTKGLSRKQVIVPIGNDNKSKFMALSSMHILNLNSILKTSNQKSWQILYKWTNTELSLQ